MTFVNPYQRVADLETEIEALELQRDSLRVMLSVVTTVVESQNTPIWCVACHRMTKRRGHDDGCLLYVAKRLIRDTSAHPGICPGEPCYCGRVSRESGRRDRYE